MFFSPENALEDFRRKVREHWNIPKKLYYLLINGKHEEIQTTEWPRLSSIRVCIKGLLGGGKKGVLTISFDGEKCRCWTTQTFREIAEDRDLEIQGDNLVDEETGDDYNIDDKVGDHFPAGCIGKVFWAEKELTGDISFMIGNDKFEGDISQTFRQAVERSGQEVQCAMLIDAINNRSLEIDDWIGKTYKAGDEPCFYWDFQEEADRAEIATEDSDGESQEDYQKMQLLMKKECTLQSDADLPGRRTRAGNTEGQENFEEIVQPSGKDHRSVLEEDQEVEESTRKEATGHNGISSPNGWNHSGHDEIRRSENPRDRSSIQNITRTETNVSSNGVQTIELNLTPLTIPTPDPEPVQPE
jgi:hypothetical protein